MSETLVTDLINRVYLLEQQITELKRRQTVLEESGRLSPRPVLKPREKARRILTLIQAETGVDVRRSASGTRHRTLNWARALAARFLMDLAGLTARQVAEQLSIDPRSVYLAARRFDDIFETEPASRARATQLIDRIQAAI